MGGKEVSATDATVDLFFSIANISPPTSFSADLISMCTY